MAETHDTIDGLLAEFRGYAAGMPPSYHVTMSWADFRKMLDRFEAAHRRERGDCAKLREFARLVSHMNDDGYYNGSASICALVGKAKAALSAPPRNCDVGTAEEQTARFAEFCKSHIHSDLPKCAGCPLEDIPDGTGCAQAWAQLPYESEAAE